MKGKSIGNLLKCKGVLLDQHQNGRYYWIIEAPLLLICDTCLKGTRLPALSHTYHFDVIDHHYGQLILHLSCF